MKKPKIKSDFLDCNYPHASRMCILISLPVLAFSHTSTIFHDMKDRLYCIFTFLLWVNYSGTFKHSEIRHDLLDYQEINDNELARDFVEEKEAVTIRLDGHSYRWSLR